MPTPGAPILKTLTEVQHYSRPPRRQAGSATGKHFDLQESSYCMIALAKWRKASSLMIVRKDLK